MDSELTEFRNSLIQHSPEMVCSIWILDRIPLIFNNDVRYYAEWRQMLSNNIEVDPSEIRIIGSAIFGISLNPNKNYKVFDDASDIDIAIISNHHFDVSWRCLRNLGSSIHAMKPIIKQSIDDHRQRLIYWGTIDTRKILPILPFAKSWIEAIDKVSMNDPINGKSVSIRIYKDFQSLRVYHLNNIKNLRQKELDPEYQNV